MQKTVVFGKQPSATDHDNPTPKPQSKPKCQNCASLEAQLTKLSISVSNSSSPNQNSQDTNHIQTVQRQLLQLKHKYMTLRRRVEKIQKQNDDFYDENTKLSKQLKSCRIQLKQLQYDRQEPLLLQNEEEQENNEENTKIEYEKRNQEMVNEHEKKVKSLEVEMFVWKEKTEKLEVLLKEQSDEIARLKQFLKRRNRLQGERHTMLEAICC